jgi:hypothetical protein
LIGSALFEGVVATLGAAFGDDWALTSVVVPSRPARATDVMTVTTRPFILKAS